MKNLFTMRMLKILVFHRNFSVTSKTYPTFFRKNPPYRRIIADIFQIKNEKTIIINDPAISKIPDHQLMKTCRILQFFQFPIKDILKDPKVLTMMPYDLHNRILLLQELGMTNIDFQFLANYQNIMKKSSSVFKDYAGIPQDCDLAKKLFSHLRKKPKVPEIDNNVPLKDVCGICMKSYLKMRLEIAPENEHVILKGINFHTKSFRIVERTLSLFQQELEFSNQKIQRNLYLISKDPEDVIGILEILERENCLKLVKSLSPKVFRNDPESIEEILKLLREKGFSENSILRNINILSMPFKTVEQRIEQLLQVSMMENLLNKTMKTPELDPFKRHPRYLSLIRHWKTMNNRLKYLKSTCKQTPSLSIFTMNDEGFNRVMMYERMKIDIEEVITILNGLFEVDKVELKKKIQIHPFWKYSSLSTIRQTFEYLKENYSAEAIYENLFTIFYPMSILSPAMEEVKKKYSGIEGTKLQDSKILSLCVYLIEVKHHFSGEGVWGEQQKTRMSNDQKAWMS